VFHLYSRIAEQEENDEIQRAGVAVSLSDGRIVLTQVDPDVLNRILDVLSYDELGELMNVIANAVENPDDRLLCKQLSKPDES